MPTIEINKHPIDYLEFGDPNADTIVLLSGWAQDNRLFKYLSPLLAKEFHVLVPDYRGHDANETVHGDFGTDDLVNDIEAFLAALKPNNPHLVSTSHGCWVNIGLCERLGIDRTVLIDWLMQPHPGFVAQLTEGQDPKRYKEGRDSFFNEWEATTDNVDVINHMKKEMAWFSGEMWMRACREILRAYDKYESPLKRMEGLAQKPRITHIYSQPLSEDYRKFQQDYSVEHPWFTPIHIPGQTHFPTLENPEAVAQAIIDFYRK
jgi:pimeloyl-ACP methyl ester carboxylesterase